MDKVYVVGKGVEVNGMPQIRLNSQKSDPSKSMRVKYEFGEILQSDLGALIRGENLEISDVQ